jgi:hypothetical protein
LELPFEKYVMKATINTTADLIHLLDNIMP